MADVCVKCKTWREEKYWNNFQPNKHHFFKIMLGDFENHLRVPRKFKAEFKGELLREVALRGPSGNIWTTELVQYGEKDLVLQNGWELFAKDHSLKPGEFLVFRYYEESSFDVLIFDVSGCEKESSFFVERNASLCTDKPHCCSLRETTSRTTRSRNSTTKSEVGVDDGEAGQSTQTKKLRKKRRAKGNKSGVVEDMASDESTVKMEEMVDDKNDVPIPGQDSAETKRWTKGKRITIIKSNRREITEEEKKQAIVRANEHATTGRSCHITMQPSSVERGFTLTIPKWFADIYLPRESQEIQLRVQPGKKTWCVQHKRRKIQCTLNKGWSEFVLDNNLETDDVCVIELVDTGASKKKVLLDVSIFRVVEDIVHPTVY